MRPVCYVIGPLRHSHPPQVVAHVLTAQAAAIMLAELGFAVYCPHSNIGFALGLLDEAHAEAVNMTFLQRSDSVFLLPGWRLSAGSKPEVKYAREHGLPRFTSKQGAREWLMTRTR